MNMKKLALALAVSAAFVGQATAADMAVKARPAPPPPPVANWTGCYIAGFKSAEERRRLYLKPGDVIEAEIERIGVLRNPVISWQEGHGAPAPPRVRPWGEDA